VDLERYLGKDKMVSVGQRQSGGLEDGAGMIHKRFLMTNDARTTNA
jgi:hypothetical protein